jgi:hypothetical protein
MLKTFAILILIWVTIRDGLWLTLWAVTPIAIWLLIAGALDLSQRTTLSGEIIAATSGLCFVVSLTMTRD